MLYVVNDEQSPSTLDEIIETCVHDLDVMPFTDEDIVSVCRLKVGETWHNPLTMSDTIKRVK